MGTSPIGCAYDGIISHRLQWFDGVKNADYEFYSRRVFMHLRDWLKRARMTQEQFAILVGVPKQTTYSWAQGKISAEAVAKVEALTNGAVTALDFFPDAHIFGHSPEAQAAQARVSRYRRSRTSAG
jgi:transcriptional regulator with XRE-family HTH domain